MSTVKGTLGDQRGICYHYFADNDDGEVFVFVIVDFIVEVFNSARTCTNVCLNKREKLFQIMARPLKRKLRKMSKLHIFVQNV